MALDTTFMTNDFDAVTDDIAQTITHSGTDYTACVGDARTEKEAQEFGAYFDEGSLLVHVKVSDFSTLPAVGDLITYESTVYRVQATLDDPAGITFRLLCVGARD